MSSILLGVMVFAVFGIFIFAIQGYGGSLASSSDVNKLNSLSISDSTGETLKGLNLGTDADITSITLTFETDIPNNSVVDISLKDNNDIEIGTGSTTVTPQSKTVIITLTGGGVVTENERETLKSASITIT